MDPQGHGNWFILFSVLIALLLSILPLDGLLAWARPHYILLVLAYWVLALPERVGVIVAWLAGLMLDILQGDVLGQNAFALAVIAYVLQTSYQRLRMFSIFKQATLIAGLTLFHTLVSQWAQGLNGSSHFNWLVILPVFSSALMWFIARPLMSWCQRLVGVN